ncbi:methyltransferase domain-containing protein [Erysipelothrix sp. HDW6C]|uniref:methyltransferase domain-containing protein n=1 Tax=Erysipelothrix sp. HDW6C TaxID=2714930 RepID=UPI0014076974|nr:methyltransferase domain-containing protein [Erysipelothrix sp. HDW6C]QIK70317.1 methyltransferase domain-containing protein [Erysipelothrix sp. HDW6C]
MSKANDYRAVIAQPWSQVFYRTLWLQIGSLQDQDILDFGCGLGITMEHYAHENTVVGIDKDYVFLNAQTHALTVHHGSLDVLKKTPTASVDWILCHNVLNYMQSPKEAIDEFKRILRPQGTLSIVVHNQPGKILHKIVFENKPTEAIALLQGTQSESLLFGEVLDYNQAWFKENVFTKASTYGLRIAYAMQLNEWKTASDWVDTMTAAEFTISKHEPFASVGFFIHYIIKQEDLR